MPWNGLGQYLLNPAFSPEVNGTVIDAVRYNGLTSDIAAGISASLAKNGENIPTANLPMGGYKHTGAAPATGNGQYVVFEQFYGMPQNALSANYTLTLTDAGKHLYHPATDANARTWTIPANAAVPFIVGTTITFINDTANVITIAITSDTLVLGEAGTTGSRSLARYGMATAVKVTATRWLISGVGLS